MAVLARRARRAASVLALGEPFVGEHSIHRQAITFAVRESLFGGVRPGQRIVVYYWLRERASGLPFHKGEERFVIAEGSFCAEIDNLAPLSLAEVSPANRQRIEASVAQKRTRMRALGIEERKEPCRSGRSMDMPDSDGDGFNDNLERARPPVPELGARCRAFALNRSTAVSEEGYFCFPQSPVPRGVFRVRVRCEAEGRMFWARGPFVHPGEKLAERSQLELDDEAPPPTGPDRDGDGLPDAIEARIGTDPDRADSNADGVADGEEVIAGADGVVTDLLRLDTDGDGAGDGFELEHGLNPLDPADGGADPDGDGLDNREEFERGSDPRHADGPQTRP